MELLRFRDANLYATVFGLEVKDVCIKARPTFATCAVPVTSWLSLTFKTVCLCWQQPSSFALPLLKASVDTDVDSSLPQQ